jgi:hypothetical protein
MNLQRQAVILKPESCSKDEDFIFKGLSSSQQLRDAYLKLKNHFQRETFRIETDNRAHFYEERRSVICQCGLELAKVPDLLIIIGPVSTDVQRFYLQALSAGLQTAHCL